VPVPALPPVTPATTSKRRCSDASASVKPKAKKSKAKKFKAKKSKAPKPDTNDELEAAKKPPAAGYIMTARRREAKDINFVMAHAGKYSEESPPGGVVHCISKVKEIKAKMVEASLDENFELADEHKQEYTIYYESSEEQIKLYHLCTWLEAHASGKMDMYAKKHEYKKVSDWKERRDVVKFIIQTTGESGLQETLSVHIMERTNTYN
jgi:hypothetical protein